VRSRRATSKRSGPPRALTPFDVGPAWAPQHNNQVVKDVKPKAKHILGLRKLHTKSYDIIQPIRDLYEGQEMYDQSNMTEHDVENLSLLLLCRANNIANWIGPSHHFPWHPCLTCPPHHPSARRKRHNATESGYQLGCVAKTRKS